MIDDTTLFTIPGSELNKNNELDEKPQEDTAVHGNADLRGLTFAQQQKLLFNTIKDLGEALLALPNPGGECKADMSGATLVSILGHAWASVGDGILIQCTVKKEGGVSLTLLNTFHHLNRDELTRARARLIRQGKGAIPLFELVKFPNTSEKGRGTLGGSQVTRALGDEWQHDEFGMSHIPEMGLFSSDDKDNSFIILASDGLFHFSAPNQAKLEARCANIEKTYQHSSKTEKDYFKKLDALDKVDHDRHQSILRLFETNIDHHAAAKGTLNASIIEQALIHTLTVFNGGNIQHILDNLTFIVTRLGKFAMVADGHGGTQSSAFIADHFEATLNKELAKMHLALHREKFAPNLPKIRSTSATLRFAPLRSGSLLLEVHNGSASQSPVLPTKFA